MIDCPVATTEKKWRLAWRRDGCEENLACLFFLK
jgi:hypothetical protein